MNKKQERVFWEAVGFGKKRRMIPQYNIFYSHKRLRSVRQTRIIAPNGGIYGYEYPCQDANNFFTWVVPAMFKISQTPQLVITILNNGEYNSDEKIAYLYEHAAGAFNISLEDK